MTRLKFAWCCVCIASFVPAAADAAWVEDFNGAFSKSWSAPAGAIPDEPIWSDGYLGTVSYMGAATGSFQTISGDQVYRLTNLQEPLERRGMVSSDVFNGTQGRLEARFNTVTQDAQHIDEFIEIWLLNASDPTQYVRAGLFGSGYSVDHGWSFASSIDGSYFQSSIGYVNDTWYRLRIDANGSSLSVSVLNDDENATLASHTFSHGLSALGSEFRVGLSQFIGGAGGNPYINDVAVDQVTASLPEPASLAAAAVAIGATLCGRSSFRRSRNAPRD